jgi:hypothetical protein
VLRRGDARGRGVAHGKGTEVVEEFYDRSEAGSVGVTGNEKGVVAGLSTGGRGVQRRVYRFRGWRAGAAPDEVRDSGEREVEMEKHRG